MQIGNVIYKNDISGDLDNVIGENYANKSALIVISNFGKKSFLNSITNILVKYNISYKCFNVAGTKFVSKQLMQENESLLRQKFDFVVGVGGGSASDVSKMFADALRCKSYFVSTILSSLSPFNSNILICDDENCYFQNSHFHTKIFVDKNLFASMKYNKFLDCQKFLFSLINCVDELAFFDDVFSKNNNQIYSQCQNEIISIFNEINNVCLEDEKRKIFFQRFICFAQTFSCLDFSKCSAFYLAAYFAQKNNDSYVNCFQMSAFILCSAMTAFFSIKNFVGINLNTSKIDFDLLERQIILSQNDIFFKKLNAIKCKFLKVFCQEKNLHKYFISNNYTVYAITCEDVFLQVRKYIENNYCNGFCLIVLKNLGMFN